jgi:hypothetical protein
MSQKEDIYKKIRIAGLLSFIPIVLAAYLFGGYFLGEFLKERFELGSQAIIICLLIGLGFGIFESARIVLRVIKEEKS